MLSAPTFDPCQVSFLRSLRPTSGSWPVCARPAIPTALHRDRQLVSICSLTDITQRFYSNTSAIPFVPPFARWNYSDSKRRHLSTCLLCDLRISSWSLSLFHLRSSTSLPFYQCDLLWGNIRIEVEQRKTKGCRSTLYHCKTFQTVLSFACPLATSTWQTQLQTSIRSCACLVRAIFPIFCFSKQCTDWSASRCHSAPS